jgi:ATP-dependent DNA helicase RecG
MTATVSATAPRPARDPSEEKRYRAVGPLAALGLSERWHVALLLPITYKSPVATLSDHRQAALGVPVEMQVSVVATPRAYYNGAPRCVVSLMDGAGEVFTATVFGDTGQWKQRFVPGSSLLLICKFRDYRGARDATILGEVEATNPWRTRVEPIYPGIPTALHHTEVRAAVEGYLPDAIQQAVARLEGALVGLAPIPDVLAHVGAAQWTLEQLLLQAHQPLSLEYAEFAREIVIKLVALTQLIRLADHHAPARPARAFPLTGLDKRANQLPFALTLHQARAVTDLATRVRQGDTLRGLLIGDVGSGKTAVFGTLCAALVADGGRAAILLPSTVLAEQVHRELSGYWPDLKPALVTGDSDATDLTTQRWLIGTSALLHRPVGAIDLTVIDEEQKFSIEQKQQLAASGGHHLTVTATCIPRTLALARYGALQVVVLPEGHATRCIETTLHPPTREAKADLFAAVRQDLRMGQQVLVIYPLRERRDPEDRHSVEGAVAAWSDAFGAEWVRGLTGDDDDARKSEVMADMREGRARILCATTVVEVGVTLQRLRRVVVIQPEKLGLSTLHQLRGRAARHGGEGFMDLVLTGPVSEKTLARLEILVQHKNGFAVAEHDMALRGYGDLGVEATRQSGADQTLLFGQPCPVALTDAVWPIYLRLRARPANSAAWA